MEQNRPEILEAQNSQDTGNEMNYLEIMQVKRIE